MAHNDPLRLSVDRFELELNPSTGGSISAFRWIGEGGPANIVRECHTGCENVLEAGNFPLVPYVNRIRDGRFRFRGRDVAIVPNMPGDPSPLHGQGWLSPWTVESRSDTEALLSFRHSAGEWPWDYSAEQHFALDESGLSLRLTCRNLADEPMPCGLGQHPYFPCGPATRIATQVRDVWTIDEHVLPVERVAATGRFDLGDRPVCGQGLDHGFGGWSGRTQLSDPAWPFRIEISSPQARFFQLYSPQEGGICVAEPVTHANAALNAPEAQWEELGLRVLEPGEAMQLDMRIDVLGR